MTEKQQKIVEAAQRLFATEGYAATSTSKVAKEAGVSEGLIFRHFGNKEGLLQAVIDMGMDRAKQLFADIVMETDPKLVIRKVLELPFKASDTEREFWHLQYKLKWQSGYVHTDTLDPLLQAIESAFRKLKYFEPEKEAQLLMILMDGLATAILKGGLTRESGMLEFILKKYRV